MQLQFNWEYQGYIYLSRKSRLELKANLEKIISDINNDSPVGINRCFMVADETWTWLNFRGNLINDAFQGVCISLGFAFIVILMTTQNIIVSLISVFSIGSIIVQMMSMINLLGWKFGLVESICVIVLVGISVDYVSHFAHMYMISSHEHKKERTDYAY